MQRWEIALWVLGWYFVIEGLLPTLFPKAWQRMLVQLGELSPSGIRQVGIVLVLLGLVFVWCFGT